MTGGPIPTLAEIDRISALEDPVIRNLQITQCYHELSAVMVVRMGTCANWCTFATWASRQAGQTIRKEDLKRLLENRLNETQTTVRAAERVAVTAQAADEAQSEQLKALALDVRNFSSILDQVSDAVARGNKKVFEEIGREFARFSLTCIEDEIPDIEKLDRFCEMLRPGDPPDGQEYLRRAFARYYRSFFETDAVARAELIFLANIEIGFHEQTRLQPEIAESLDAGMVSSARFIYQLITGIFPLTGWITLAHLYLMRLLGRPTALDLAIRILLNDARILMREMLTDILMTISFPNGVQLRLGDDLSAAFPDSLKRIADPELRDFLARYDPTPDSLVDSGALDWANLPERLHFIIDMFRCYQENADLILPPFNPEQVEKIKAGELPAGRL